MRGSPPRGSHTLTAAEPPLAAELEAIEVGAALLELLTDEAGTELDEATELSWAIAPLAAKAARSATGTMLNFIFGAGDGDK